MSFFQRTVLVLLLTAVAGGLAGGLAAPSHAQNADTTLQLQTPQLPMMQVQPVSPNANTVQIPQSVLENLQSSAQGIQFHTPPSSANATPQVDTVQAEGGLQVSIPDRKTRIIDGADMMQKVRTATRRPAGESAASPEVYVSPDLWLSNHPETGVAQGQLVFRSMQDGFVIGDDPPLFTTTLKLWLQNREDPSRAPLGEPQQVVISAQDARRISEPTLELTHWNEVSTITLDAEARRGDSIRVSIGLPTDPEPASAYLQVRRPQLRLSPSQTAIPGFGLGETELQVIVDRPFPNAVTLSINSESAGVEPAMQRVEPGIPATFTIRSSGVGTETLRVDGGPFAAASRTTQLTFTWPVYFILFAVAGSLVGAGVRYYRRQSSAEDPDALRLSGILTSGVLIGIIAAVLYAIGISITSVIPAGMAGQAVVFAISAAAAVIGPNLPFESSLPNGNG
jgi:hypothetical protein